MHGCSTQFFRRDLLPNRCLHQCWASQEKPAAVRHQDVVTHHRQITAARNTHAHDCGNLRNPHRRHHRIVSKYPSEVVSIGKNVFLQRKEYPGRIDQIDDRDPVLDRDVLRPNDFLRRHRKERASLNCGIVGDDHQHAAFDPCQPGDYACRRRSAPFFVHAVARE